MPRHQLPAPRWSVGASEQRQWQHRGFWEHLTLWLESWLLDTAGNRNHSGPADFSGGRNQPSRAALVGWGLASWSLTVSLPVSELPARSCLEA